MESFSEIMTHNEVYLLRLFLAMLFGGLIGIERQVRGRSAGLRTNILVCLGSAGVIVAFQKLSTEFQVGQIDAASIFRVDPARAAAGVITGIGFLGAGTIIKSNDIIRGLTTAASIWVVATIGITVGLGEYVIGITLTVLVLTALYFFHLIPIKTDHYFSIRLAWDGKQELIQEVIDSLKNRDIKIKGRNIAARPKDKTFTAELIVCLRGDRDDIIPAVAELQTDTRFNEVELH